MNAGEQDTTRITFAGDPESELSAILFSGTHLS